MGKQIIWTSDALEQLEDIHFYILLKSKSIQITNKVTQAIYDSVQILETNPEIYKLDKQKVNNDGSFRVYSVYDYSVSYQITETTIQILRVRHNVRKL